MCVALLTSQGQHPSLSDWCTRVGCLHQLQNFATDSSHLLVVTHACQDAHSCVFIKSFVNKNCIPYTLQQMHQLAYTLRGTVEKFSPVHAVGASTNRPEAAAAVSALQQDDQHPADHAGPGLPGCSAQHWGTAEQGCLAEHACLSLWQDPSCCQPH